MCIFESKETFIEDVSSCEDYLGPRHSRVPRVCIQLLPTDKVSISHLSAAQTLKQELNTIAA